VSDSGGQGDDGGLGQDDSGAGGGNPCVAPASIELSPADLTRDLQPGDTLAETYTAIAHYAGQPDADITAQSFFAASDSTVGTFTDNVFTWGGGYGGALTISATHCGQTGTALLNLLLHAAFVTPDVDPGTAQGQFDNAGGSSVTACAPTLVYPPDGVLLPPNTNVVEVHFLPGAGNSLYEISFKNAVTDVRVYTRCTGSTPAEGLPYGGGCIFELSQTEWDYIAFTNREGLPVTVKVRALGCDGTNAASSATRSISFARDDLLGVLYYWASMRTGTNTNSGGVYRYDFGVRGQSAEAVLTPTTPPNTNGLCIGCHSVSRDGRQMIFDFDDNDDDDEYGDVWTDIMDLVSRAVVTPIVKNSNNPFPPGFHTWNRSTTQFLLSDGPGDTATPVGAFYRLGPDGTLLGYTMPGSLRGTTPDWAPDDSQVVFAAPPNVLASAANFATAPAAGYWQHYEGPRDDHWFAGASLYAAPWDATTNQLGTPALILPSTTVSGWPTNYYYPSFSPDGSLIAFNYAVKGPNFHNELARVQLVVAAQSSPMPADLAKLNDAGNLTNSWPRWAPFLQTYQGRTLLWITFSSTRGYGLRIDNGGTKHNCYPTESPSGYPAFPAHNDCRRTQLWMAAIRLDANAVANQQDVSLPAFWLPFQDLTTNNHLGQWTQRKWNGPCGAGNTCPNEGDCCENGGCTPCPKPQPQPQPTCSADVNCATGQCCPA
jgi:hypothetical protein